MPETASSQPLPRFHSPVMVAIERLLGQLARRVAGPQSQFGSRNQRFVDRLLSRQLDVIGPNPSSAAEPQGRERQLQPQSWLLPQSWVPSATELRRAALPAAPPEPARGPSAAPTSSSAIAGRRVVAAPPARAGVAPSLPMVAPELPSRPSAPLVGPTAAAVAQPAPTASPAAQALSQPSLAPSLTARAPAEAVAEVALGSVVAPLPAAESSAPASTVSLPAVDPVGAQPVPIERSSVATAVAPSSPAALSPAVAAAAVADPAAVAPVVVPPAEARVRDWLRQESLASPAAIVPTPASASLARRSSITRAFGHLGWADGQLGRSLSPPSDVESPSSSPPVAPRALTAPALPMLATAALSAPARRTAAANPLGQPTPSASLPSLAAPRPSQLPLPAVAAVAPPASLLAPAPAAGASPRPAASSPVRVEAAALAALPWAAAPSLSLAVQPQLAAAPSVAPSVASSTGLPTRWSAPGALAAHLDRVTDPQRPAAAAHGPAAGAAGLLQDWAPAPGLPASLVRLIQGDRAASAGRLPSLAPSLPYLPAPSAGPVAAAGPVGKVAAASAAPLAGPASPSASRPSPAAASAATLASLVAAPQPWRQPGGTATMAELFAAGVSLGSGSVGALAQAFGAAQSGLVPDWLQPLLQRSSQPVASESSSPVASAASPLPLLPSAMARPPAVGDGRAVAGAPRHPGLVGMLAAGLANPDAASVSPAGRWASSTAGLVWVPREEPAAAAASSTPSRPRPLTAYSQAGGLGLRTEMLAESRSVHVAGAAPAAASELRQWLRAPGVSAPLSRALSRPSAASDEQPAAQRPSRWSQVQSELPWLAPPVAPPAAGPAPAVSRLAPAASAAAAVRATANLAAPSSAAPPQSLTGEGRRAASSSGEAQPWLAAGGTAALAELFAAGVGLGSGAAAWLPEALAPARGGLLSPWLRSLVGAPDGAGAKTAPGGESSRALPSLPPLSYLGWEAPRSSPGRLAATPSPTSPVASSAATLAPGATAAASPAARRSAWGGFSQPGGVSVGAEQFAAVHGLGTMAAPEAGRYLPVAGGLVWVAAPSSPTAAASSTAGAGNPAAAGAAPSRPGAPAPALATGWSQAGGLGLHLEMIAATQAGRSGVEPRSTGPGMQLLSFASPAASPSVSEGVAASPPRLGWSGAGGLIYLGPSAVGAPNAGAATGRRPSSLSILDLASAGLPGSSSLSPPRATPALSLPLAVPPLATAAAARSAVANGSPAASRFPTLGGAQQVPTVGERIAATYQPAPDGADLPPPRGFGGGLPLLGPSEWFSSARTETRGSNGPGRAAALPDLGSRYAAPMLTGFPRDATATQAPQMLWPQATQAASERLSKLLAQLPTDWQSSPSVVAALQGRSSDAPKPQPGIGGPLWQRLPSSPPQVALDPLSDETTGDSDGDSMATRSPQQRSGPLTMLRGGERRSPEKSGSGSAPPSQRPAQRAPDIEMITAALNASGAKRSEVDASIKLMQAIGSPKTTQGARSDDRLNLSDLTMIAISMGQGRMAASSSAAGPHAGGAPSVEAALRLPEHQHPPGQQDAREVRKKVGHLADLVIKKYHQLKATHSIRRGGA